jgi:hypothetical protein
MKKWFFLRLVVFRTPAEVVRGFGRGGPLEWECDTWMGVGIEKPLFQTPLLVKVRMVRGGPGVLCVV